MQREDGREGLRGAVVQVRRVIRDREQRGDIKPEAAQGSLARRGALSPDLERIEGVKRTYIFQVLELFLERVLGACQGDDLRPGGRNPGVDWRTRYQRSNRIGIAGKGRIVEIENLALGPLRSPVARRTIGLKDGLPLRECRGVCWLGLKQRPRADLDPGSQ